MQLAKNEPLIKALEQVIILWLMWVALIMAKLEILVLFSGDLASTYDGVGSHSFLYIEKHLLHH